MPCIPHAKVTLGPVLVAIMRTYAYHVERTPVKKRVLEKLLRKRGWRLLREGRSHEIWTDGISKVAMPRHREIAERTTRSILMKADFRKEDE